MLFLKRGKYTRWHLFTFIASKIEIFLQRTVISFGSQLHCISSRLDWKYPKQKIHENWWHFINTAQLLLTVFLGWFKVNFFHEFTIPNLEFQRNFWYFISFWQIFPGNEINLIAFFFGENFTKSVKFWIRERMWWSTHNPQSSPIFVKFVANNVCLFKRSNVKGQLILKVLFCCYRFFQKMNEHFDLIAMIAQIELCSSFFWKIWWHPKSPFKINWPLTFEHLNRLFTLLSTHFSKN